MIGCICPFCQHFVASTPDTVRHHALTFYGSAMYNADISSYQVRIHFLRCPNCQKESIVLTYTGTKMPKGVTIPIYPRSLAKQFPDYIPKQIREDYEEAYSIVSTSPKASATLARRCLQGMIHDFWDIHERNLSQEILKLKDKVSPSQWAAIDALRQLGNIGAHMENDTNLIVDIDSNEAEKLLKLIELLLDKWYINRYEEELLLQEITATNLQKQQERKS